MKLRTFTASDTQQAMKMVREALGDNAVILSSTRDTRSRSVSIIAARDEREDAGAYEEPAITPQFTHARLKPEHDVLLGEVETILRFHQLPDYLLEQWMETGRYLLSESRQKAKEADDVLQQIIEAALHFMPLTPEKKGSRMMLVGPPGAGKTVSIARIAAQLALRKMPVNVISLDTKRAGGVEQLDSLMKVLGIKVKSASSRNELRDILKGFDESERVLIDSPGANPYEYTELKHLAELASLEDIEPILTVAAGADTGEAEETARAFAFLGIRRLLVTRVDAARRFGSILTMAAVADLSLCSASNSEKIATPFEKLNPETLCNLLTTYQSESRK